MESRLDIKGKLLRTAARFLMSPPPIDRCPPGPSVVIQDRIMALASPVVRLAAIKRSNDYATAGCPPNLCDTAAARDLWGATIGIEE